MATVRYVNSSSGLNVRDSAAGTKVTTLNNGDLMYDIPGVANVTASWGGLLMYGLRFTITTQVH